MINRDFREFFELLNANAVKYLLIGGVAYNAYAPPRATKDIDIWVGPDRDNLQRLERAIQDFGFPTDALDLDDLASRHKVLMMGRAPNRIDVLTQPDGVAWHEAWERRIQSAYGDVEIFVISIGDLIRQKQAADRPQDRVDVARLEEISRRSDRAG